MTVGYVISDQEVGGTGMENNAKKFNYTYYLMICILFSLFPFYSDSSYSNQFYYQVYIGVLFFMHTIISRILDVFLKAKIKKRPLYKILFLALSAIKAYLFYLFIIWTNSLISEQVLLFYEDLTLIILVFSAITVNIAVRDVHLETVAEALEKKKK